MSMTMSREIPIRDLPPTLTHQVHEQIRLHSVAMAVSARSTTEPMCCSGTFVRINDMPGILTARHVWTKIQRSSRLALLVGGRPYEVDPSTLRALGPSDQATLPEVNASVPDVTFLRLPEPFYRAIESYNKVFYSIDIRRQDTQLDLFGEQGFWILTGSPQILFDTEHRLVPSFFYDTSVERRTVCGDWDYLFVNLNLDKNPGIPRTYGGVSGGGIWRATFSRTEDETGFTIKEPARDILLCGVAFYETAMASRQILGHGPKSLYETLYTYITD
jgi:hypothetical protein